MGCLKFISSLISKIFTVLVILILLFPCGGLNFIKNTIYSFFNPPEKILMVNAQKVADFSQIPDNYELIKAYDMFGINAVIAQENKTRQKVAVVNTGWVLNITKEDIKSNTAISKLEEITKNIKELKNININLDQVKIEKKGSFTAFNQDIPYIKAKIKLSGDQKRNFEGIIGVVTKPNLKNDLLVSINEPGKYNQKVAEKFFRKIKYNNN